MKRKWMYIFLSCLIIISVTSCANNSDFPVLKGPYLGQKPPGMTPEVFAPGIISTEHKEHSTLAFSPDGTEIFRF